ncbi:MAG: hypothetical protein ACOX44_14110 [Limnochordia bacterium]
MGQGVRVALDRAVQLNPPAGYELTEVPANLEDLFFWLTGAAEKEVSGR